MAAWLSALALCSALLHLRAEHRGSKRQVYLFKPLTTSLILAFALFAPAAVAPFYRYAVVLGLALSLAGDIFLMLPSDRFVAGLVSFLAAHLCYGAAFVTASGAGPAPWWALPFLVYGGVLLRFLWPHTGRLRGPVALYGLALVGMAWLACAWWWHTRETSALLALSGAVLFVASDSVLAINRFVREVEGAQFMIMSTYYAAQWLIAASIVF